ncbi:hypothetical protein ACFLQR_04760 [Verrucomicrobiota bacterium]
MKKVFRFLAVLLDDFRFRDIEPLIMESERKFRADPRKMLIGADDMIAIRQPADSHICICCGHRPNVGAA